MYSLPGGLVATPHSSFLKNGCISLRRYKGHVSALGTPLLTSSWFHVHLTSLNGP